MRHSRTRAACAAATGSVALLAALLGPAAPAGAVPDATSGAPVAAPVADGTLLSYVVNTRANRGQVQKAERAVVAHGGTVVASYPEIGVVVAQSAVRDFAARVRTASGVESAGQTRTAAVVTPEDSAPTPGNPASVPPAEGTAYDVTAVKADQAHLLPGGKGSRDVLVAVLDSGIDDVHEDLAANFDAAASAGCTDGGRLDRDRSAWLPTSSDHGTHVAGTIAADDNGKGVVGVAPDVRVSSVKVVDENGFIYPEYAICGYVWAAETGADVSNASLYVDPWQYWCQSDPDQAAAIESVQRAVSYATRSGVLSVAAAGNDYRDLASKGVDTSSPNDTTPVPRDVSTGCVDIPAELDGVVTTSSTTATGEKSAFSNYGLGVIDVSAPGSSIWSTTIGDTYGRKSGTSMASPHAAGVAALLASTHPGATPAQLLALLRGQADDTPCTAPIVPPGRAPQTCTGPAEDNAFYGDGRVDALEAVTR